MSPARIAQLTVAAILLVACAPAAPRTDMPRTAASLTTRQRLTATILADPPGMFKHLTNPSGNGNVPGLSELMQMMHAGATYHDDRDVLQPLVAEAVPSFENGFWKIFPDGRMETSWRLKPDVAWHDGTPLTAEDLVFATRVYGDREVGLVNPAPLGVVEAVDAPDPRTVVVRWREPFIEADTMFTVGLVLPLPRHLLDRSFGEDKENFFNTAFWNQQYVGLGAFKLREWIPGSHLVMAANDRYVLGRPKLDEIEVRFLTNVDVVVANILSGSIEKHIGRGIGVDQALQIREAGKEQNVLLGGELGSVVPIYPQFVIPDPPIMTNLDFRRALLLAIDRQEMTDSLNHGLSPIAHAWLQPDRPEYPAVERKIVRYEYDPRRAAQAIEALGYSKGPDGMYQDTAGQKLHVDVRTTAQRFIHPLASLSVADYWKRIGIDSDVTNAPIPLLSDLEYRSQFPGVQLVVSGTTAGSSSIRQYQSSQTPLPSTRFVGANRARYQNPTLDSLIERYVSTIPMNDRLVHLGDILQIQTDQLSFMSLFYEGNVVALGHNRLKGVTSSKVWNAHLWHLEG